jgi:hypothetical protein
MLPEEGPTLEEVKQRQRSLGEAGKIAGEVIKDADHIWVVHHVEHLGIHHLFGAANAASKLSLLGNALALLHLGYEVTEKVYELTITKWMEEGKELAEGRDRDQKNLALLMIVTGSQPDVLPDGYYQSECSRVLGTSGKADLNKNFAFKNASSLLGKAVTDPELARARDILVASMREGVTTAYRLGIDSDVAFKRLMATDPDFRSRFASDPAFRSGVNSVVWQATLHRNEYEESFRLSVQSRVPTERM